MFLARAHSIRSLYIALAAAVPVALLSACSNGSSANSDAPLTPTQVQQKYAATGLCGVPPELARKADWDYSNVDCILSTSPVSAVFITVYDSNDGFQTSVKKLYCGADDANRQNEEIAVGSNWHAQIFGEIYKPADVVQVLGGSVNTRGSFCS